MNRLTCVGKLTTGHGSFPPMAAISGESNVTVNGAAVVVEGDEYANHGHGTPPPNPFVVPGSGNPNIQINGVPAAYVGLVLSCGDTIAEGVTE